MSGKTGRLGRLLAIRRLGEELGRGTLGQALASVAEVETALGTQGRTLVEGRLAARTALTAGDRGEWLMADAQSEMAGWNRQGLSVLLRARAGEVAPAMEAFLVSRREHEQVKRLVEDARQVARIDEDRKAQAASDDWFLGRRVRARRERIMNRS